MKRHPAFVPLSKDHHRALIIAQLLKKGAPKYKDLPFDIEGKAEHALNFYQLELIPHFRLEDEIIFPFLAWRETFLDNYITNAILEHQQLRFLFLLLEGGRALEDIEDRLGKFLENHIRDEEMKLFDKAQDVVLERDLVRLQQKILEIKKSIS